MDRETKRYYYLKEYVNYRQALVKEFEERDHYIFWGRIIGSDEPWIWYAMCYRCNQIATVDTKTKHVEGLEQQCEGQLLDK